MFMSVKSLEGSQLWERLLLLVTDPRKRVAVLQQEHAAYMQVSNMHQPCSSSMHADSGLRLCGGGMIATKMAAAE